MAEFQVVNRKRKNKHHRKKNLDQSLTERLQNLKSDLKLTNFFAKYMNVIRDALKNVTDKPELENCGMKLGTVGVVKYSKETNLAENELSESVSELDIRDEETNIQDRTLEDRETVKHLLMVSKLGKEISTNLDKRIQELVCYGLGSFSESYIARYQLVFLLLVIEEMEIPLCNCHIFDPQFTEEEKVILQEFGLNIIVENEVGKRRCNRRTLFYMPHCGKALYNNLLWANWGTNLDNMIIIGNSFTSMVERIPKRIIEEFGYYILKIEPYMTEKELPVTEKYEDVFNDTVIHIFNDVNSKVSEDFWEDNDEPMYDGFDPEIIFS